MKNKINIIIRNAKDNPALLASKVARGDVGRITRWFANLGTGSVFIYSLGKEMPVTFENII